MSPNHELSIDPNNMVHVSSSYSWVPKMGEHKKKYIYIFWIEHGSLELHATRYFHTTSYLDICHTWIKERDHSKITLLLQLNHGLQN